MQLTHVSWDDFDQQKHELTIHLFGRYCMGVFGDFPMLGVVHLGTLLNNHNAEVAALSHHGSALVAKIDQLQENNESPVSFLYFLNKFIR